MSLKFKRLKEYDTIWHPDSTIVLKSATEKVAVGRFVDGEMIKFDDETLKLCKKWKFKYEAEKEKSVEKDVEEEAEEEDAEEEEVEEEDAEEEDAEEEEAVEEDAEKEDAVEEDAEKEDAVESKQIPEKEQADFSVKFVFLNKCLSELSSSVHSHKKNTEKEIDILKNKLVEKNKEYDSLYSKFNEVEDKYIKLKTKFEGIKNLFA